MNIKNNESILWQKNIKHYTYKERTIVCNFTNGQWLKISEECFTLLDTFVQDAYTYQEILGVFENKADRTHIAELIEKLFAMEALRWSSEKDEGNTIKHFHFNLTDRCNLSCIHCCANAGTVQDKDALSTEDAKHIIDTCIAWGAETIIFTGGEPLVRKDFLELLRYTRKSFTGKITLMTNAVLINNTNITDIAQCIDSIDISLDGYDEASCSAIRGKGVYLQVLASIKLLQQHGIDNISLSMVSKEDDDAGDKKFKALCEKLQVKPIIREFADIGRGEQAREHFQAEESQEKTPRNIITDPIEQAQKKKELQQSIEVCTCGALRNSISIDASGNLSPCLLLMDEKYHLGHINSYADISYAIETEAYYTVSWKYQ